ncbi:outer membrane lipoprotein LolB [Oceanospirillum linum]|nr:lipoprotein insertase outer membrane protein LolB [Oceanospirillum linum]SEG33708.1 outer membrane lipoprotein LolB [Oleiphilus messinensis]SMP29400.1 outer membrane lipoprotein LolB [Oceanospirillum linum]
MIPSNKKYNNIRRLLRSAAISILVVLSGCGTTEPLKQASTPFMDQHNRNFSQLTHFQIEGKIRLKTKDSSDSANLQWQQEGEHYNMTLSGPFGQTGARMEGSPYQVMLTIPDKGRFIDQSPEQLLYNHFGWDLPISSLLYWIRTLPAPGSSYQSDLNQAQQIRLLQQDGWNIHYDRYRPVSSESTQSPELPGRIKVNRGQLELTLIINQWQLSAHQLARLQ